MKLKAGSLKDKQYNIPILNQEEVENTNRPITSTEMDSVILKLPANKSPGELLHR